MRNYSLGHRQCARIFGATIGLLVSAVAFGGTNYHVAVDGSDSNPGTENAPFATVQKAIDIAQSGDTVLVRGGFYPESVATKRPGTSGARIVLDGQGVATMHNITLRHAYVTLANMRITGRKMKFARALYLDRGAHYAIVRNNYIDMDSSLKENAIAWNVGTGIPFDPDAASNCIVESNVITRVLGATCITIGGQNNLIVNNVITNVFTVDIFRLFGKDNTIRGNYAVDHWYVPDIGFHADWIQTFGSSGRGSMGHVIEQNFAMNMPHCQLAQVEPDGVEEIRDWTFRNNIFVGFSNGGGITIPETKWYNNLFVDVNNVAGSHAISFGLDVDGGQADGTIVKNNVFIDCGQIDRDNVGWYSFRDTLVNVQADYNVVAKNAYGPVRAGTEPVGSGQHDNFRFYELHGINGGNPMFENRADLDFRLLSDSPLIGKGVNLTEYFQNDSAGHARPRAGAWDIGPYQFAATIGVSRPAPLQGFRAVD